MYSKIKISFVASLMLLFSSMSHADDLDILNAETLVDANILFVMDLSGSMDTLIDGSTATRLEELSGAFDNIVADNDFSKVNFGLSVFSGGAQSNIGAGLAHGITYPVGPIIGTPAQDILSKPGFVHPSNSYMPAAGTTETRQYLSLLSSDTSIWSANGATPIVDALFEASRYFRGEEVVWGRYTADDIRSAHPSSYVGTLTNNTVTVTPACTAASRESCTKGSCGATEDCNVSMEWQTRPDDTDGEECTTNTNRTCTTSLPYTCGTGNCVIDTQLQDFWCDESISTIADCKNANSDRTLESCSTYDDTDCTTDNEGQTTCTVITKVRCKENVEINRCEDVDNYTCKFPVESCTTCPSDETTTTVAGSAIYKSPIKQECAANGIILLTDGAPTVNGSADQVATMIGSTYANNCNSGSFDGRCGPELALFMSSEDHANGSTSVPNINGLQNVKTYAVGLALDVTIPEEAATKAYLDNISMNGNGNPAIIAANKDELTQAFKDAINDVVGKARSFSSPSYSVDTTTQFTNGPYVYIPMFDRSSSLWPGNIKKFKLVDGVLTDKDGLPALDASGALLDTAKDLWSTGPSIDSIKSGGAANLITPSSRKMLTNSGTSLIPLSTSIPNGDFGLSSSATDTAYKDELVTFISGLNPSDNSKRNHMGDIIHSKPVQLNYANGSKLVFVGSNEGYLHAINDNLNEAAPTNGSEAFAFMPKELLKNIKDQYSGVPLPQHMYGVDGLVTLWLDESATTDKLKIDNGVLDAGEKAYIFFGLRRGGSSYTAINVTDPANPILMWSKSFDSANSWSQPVVTNLRWKPNTTDKPVMIIGGGFNDDASGTEMPGGNNVYIIDAMTGTTVWSATTAFSQSKVSNFTGAALPNAVPTRIRAIDLDRNNSVDKLYFGDTGGNIWRVDVNAANFDAITSNDNDISKATLHRIAALGGTGADNRQFFVEPDVSIFKQRGKLTASIAIGSGSRPNPLSTAVEDKFFVIYDNEVTSPPVHPLITLSSGNLKTAPVSKADQLATTYRGWQKPLNTATGEKIMSAAVTYQGRVLFNSFALTSLEPDPCNPSNTNENKLYVIDIFAGSEDAVITHTGGEIVGPPKIGYPHDAVCVKDDCKREPVIFVNKIKVDFPIPKDIDGNPVTTTKNIEKVYWIDSDK